MFMLSVKTFKAKYLKLHMDLLYILSFLTVCDVE